DGKALQNAKFKLKYRKKAVDEWSYVKGEDNNDLVKTSGEDGKFEFTKLKPGFYELEEISAPDGYNILTNPAYEFVVNSNGKIIRKTIGDTAGEEKKTEEDGIVPIYIENKKKQKISFKKVDASTKNPLKDAKFEVYYKKNKSDEYSNEFLKLYEKTTDGKVERLVLKSDEKAPSGFNEVESFTSGNDGIVDFTFYESGYYALKEIKAPSGYITPKDYVKEFAAIGGKIQEEKYKTEMSVKKTQTWSNSKPMYKTDISTKINPNHENITYIKDKSKLILSGFAYANESSNSNTPISIKAYLVDSEGKKTDSETYTLTDSDYTNGKGKIEIDLYNLVNKLEKKDTTNKTIVFEMSSLLNQDTVLDINSSLVINDKEKEDRTFHIGTRTDQHIDHSFNFDNMADISNNSINIENKKLTLPLTNGIRPWLGFTILGLILMILGVWYYN
ncbi:MAG: prealbumin-like fold domain-containing protein, partial [Anaerococcus sp.]|nr:prealbumin-like fold domain-containing protein [Anaerococcus sp.]